MQNVIATGKVMKIRMEKVYLDLAKAVNKSKILPDKDMDLSNSLNFLKEIIKNKMDGDVQASEDASGVQEAALESSVDSSWQNVISPLASFETEYDLHVKNSEEQYVPSLVFAKVSNQPNGKTFQLIACSTN